jgi:hypothetical protein
MDHGLEGGTKVRLGSAVWCFIDGVNCHKASYATPHRKQGGGADNDRQARLLKTLQSTPFFPASGRPPALSTAFTPKANS